MIERYWFFTWRTYGTWLPGEDGFVGQFRKYAGHHVTENGVNSPTAPPMPELAEHSRQLLTHPPVRLDLSQCVVVEGELFRTCEYHGWVLEAVAVIPNHVHLLFGVPHDPDHNAILAELKAYCSRVLNKPARRPKGWWWADGGSTKPVRGEAGRAAVAEYVRTQPGAVRVWLSDEARRLIAEYKPELKPRTLPDR